MPIKTVLVHLSHDADHMTRLRCAIELARANDAHITAVYVATPAHMPAEITGRGASLGYIAAATETAHEHAVEVEKEFRELCRAEGISIEWRTAEGDHTRIIAHHASFADITIVSQHPHDFDHRLAMDFPDSVALHAGGPVLLLPPAYDGAPFGRKIVLAWKPTREATRAWRDALPFLKQAEEVYVLTFPEGRADLPGAEIAATLARHGVTAHVVIDESGHGVSGERILADCAARSGDLLVMGGYGHSRVRELIFGGVSHHCLNHAELPVLVSH